MPRAAVHALAAAVVLALVAAPLAAYTIYLKDGSKIIARDPYQVEGDRALITLVNGTQSFIELSQIDVERTQTSNDTDYGSAVVLEGSSARALPGAAPEPTDEKSLQDLITERSAGVRPLPEQRRPEAATRGPRRPRTGGGWTDLTGVPRRPYSDEALTTELKTFLRSKGFDNAKVFQGTASSRPFLELSASSEAGVFRALGAAAGALLHARERFGGGVEAVELLILTPNQERAGQFLIKPEQATALVNREVEPTAFFLAYVQF